MKKMILYPLTSLLGAFLLATPAFAAPGNPLTGNYYGTATITSPAMIGTIDLAFHLDVGATAAGSAIQKEKSYIIVDRTLVFPPQNPPQQHCETSRVCDGAPLACRDVARCVEMGPQVTGDLSLTSFKIESDVFKSIVQEKAINRGGTTLDNLEVSRKVTLSNAVLAKDGVSITGDYLERISGSGSSEVELRGVFVITKPGPLTAPKIVANNAATPCIDVPGIRSAGYDANVIEYGDISQALHIYNTPSASPNICSPREAVLKEALTQYYNSLK